MGEELKMAGAFGEGSLTESDAVLLKLAAQGDGAAFQKLVDRHAAGLLRLACGLVGNRSDAEDVVQETFLGAFKAAGTFEGRSTVRTWLGQILVRQAAALRRSRRTRQALALEESVLANRGTPRSVQVDRREDVMVMLQRLSPEHREVIVLREFEQMSYDEIASALGVPRGTVESRLHRARAELRSLLGDYEP